MGPITLSSLMHPFFFLSLGENAGFLLDLWKLERLRCGQETFTLHQKRGDIGTFILSCWWLVDSKRIQLILLNFWWEESRVGPANWKFWVIWCFYTIWGFDERYGICPQSTKGYWCTWPFPPPSHNIAMKMQSIQFWHLPQLSRAPTVSTWHFLILACFPGHEFNFSVLHCFSFYILRVGMLSNNSYRHLVYEPLSWPS